MPRGIAVRLAMPMPCRAPVLPQTGRPLTEMGTVGKTGEVRQEACTRTKAPRWIVHARESTQHSPLKRLVWSRFTLHLRSNVTVAALGGSQPAAHTCIRGCAACERKPLPAVAYGNRQ